MRTGTRWTVLGITLLALIMATVLTLTDMRLASSQTVTLVAKRSEAVPLDDPFARVWKGASPVQVPLSGQNVVPPMAGSERTITARALHDGQRLYVLAEWKDDSEDRLVSRQTEFTDAVAVQFPVAAGETVPPFCMGDPNAHVNIWQWKAAWQADIEQGFVDVEDAYPNTQVDLYPFEEEEIFNPARALGNVAAQVDRTTAADNLLAGSFGNLTQAPDQIVQGWGKWRDGRWLVVFARDLQVNSDYTQFAEGDNTSVAFAVWDGAAGERDGMKSVSQFLTLDVSPEVAKVPGEGIPAWVIILVVVGGVALAIAGSVTYFARRRRA